MLQRLVKTVSTTLLCEIDSFYPTMMEAARLTLQCLRSTATELDETWHMEAFDELLNMWLKLSK
jgi:hypothetical protein